MFFLQMFKQSVNCRKSKIHISIGLQIGFEKKKAQKMYHREQRFGLKCEREWEEDARLVKWRNTLISLIFTIKGNCKTFTRRLRPSPSKYRAALVRCSRHTIRYFLCLDFELGQPCTFHNLCLQLISSLVFLHECIISLSYLSSEAINNTAFKHCRKAHYYFFF